ncbi:hypothetical protein YC2023_066706 [Brassica napus]
MDDSKLLDTKPSALNHTRTHWIKSQDGEKEAFRPQDSLVEELIHRVDFIFKSDRPTPNSKLVERSFSRPKINWLVRVITLSLEYYDPKPGEFVYVAEEFLVHGKIGIVKHDDEDGV